MELDLRQNLIPLLRELSLNMPDKPIIGFLLADHLLEFGFLDEAENQFKKFEHQQFSYLPKAGIARIHFLKGEFNICKNIIQELLDAGFSDFNLILLYVRALLNVGLEVEANLYYEKLVMINPYLGPIEKLNSRLKS